MAFDGKRERNEISEMTSVFHSVNLISIWGFWEPARSLRSRRAFYRKS